MTLNKTLTLLISFLWINAYSQTEIKKKYYSSFVKDSIPVTIWLPNNYIATEKYPVFYEFVYDHSSYLASVLQNYFDAPKSIVVHADFDAGNSHYSHSGLTKTGEKYYQFLIQELIPSVEKEFNTSQYRVAVGLSQGADYANYILRNNPELFKAWLIFSIEKPNYEPDFSEYKKLKQPVDYLIATANDEPYRIEFANSIYDNLKANQLFNIEIQRYPNSTHAYSILYGFPDALKFIFDSYINLRPAEKNENILEYSANLKEEIKSKFGIEPEFNNFLSQIVRELKQIGDTAQIDAVLKDILPKCTQLQLFNVAYALVNIGAVEKAENLLWNAVALMPKDKASQQLNPTMPYRTLALNIYDKQGNYEEAFRILKNGHEKIKNYDMGLLYYIGMYSLKQNFHVQEGIKALEEILIKRESSEMSAFFSEDMVNAQIAEGYARLNNKKQAKFYAKKALEVNPNNNEARRILERVKIN